MKHLIAVIVIIISYVALDEYLGYRKTPTSMPLNLSHNPLLKSGDCLELSLPDSKTDEKRYVLIKSFIKESREYKTTLYSPVAGKFIPTDLNLDALDAEKMIKVIKCP